jgi:hypothetical protein
MPSVGDLNQSWYSTITRSFIHIQTECKAAVARVVGNQQGSELQFTTAQINLLDLPR